VKAEVPVESSSSIIYRVDNQGTGTEVMPAAYTTPEGVD